MKLIPEEMLPKTPEQWAACLAVVLASERRCWICHRRLESSWAILTDKQLQPIGQMEYHIGETHRCHYTCAFEWIRSRSKYEETTLLKASPRPS